MKRRSLLASTGFGISAISGCIDLSSDTPPQLAPGRIEIQNNSSENINIRIKAEKKKKVIYEDIISLDAVEEGGNHPAVHSEIISDDWLGDQVSYELSMEIVDQDLEASSSVQEATAHFQEFGPDNLDDGDCFAWFAEIGYFPTRELDAIRLSPEIIYLESDTLPHSCG